MSFRSVFAIVLVGWSTFWIRGELPAQAPRPLQPTQDSLLLDIDNAATKKFGTVQSHLRAGQLREAVQLLQSISDAHAGNLVAVGKGRYVNTQAYVQMLSAGLSPEGRRIYRQILDPGLRPAFEAARVERDETQLEKIVLQGYCCSFTDDALLLLGDLAWDAGDVWRARSYWEQLLTPPPPPRAGEPAPWLAYPDSDLDPALIAARLVLCSIDSGQRQEIERDLAAFERQFSTSQGALAGQQGSLLAILQRLASDAGKWIEPVRTSPVATFTGNYQRRSQTELSPSPGRLRWRHSLNTYGEQTRRGFRPALMGGTCYYPVVFGDIVLLNDDEQILAYRMQDGTPAWSDQESDAQIYSMNFDPGGGLRGLEAGQMPVGNIGWPRFTMTIADGRLYARMGSVRPFSNDRAGVLVCLDLAHGEGKIVWEVFANSLDSEAGGWIFEGSPVVEGGRVYMGLRRVQPQPQANVACFDALTGKLIWNRKICVGQANPNFPEFDINQHLLTLGGGSLYYVTHMGAVAALDPQQGQIKWIASYPRLEDTRLRHEFVVRLQRGPLPAMFANGMLYVAPIDSNEVLAFDGATGLLKWQRTLPSPVQDLLGVAEGLVFASGSQLWALDSDDGSIAWKLGDADPESHGFGRGFLTEELIYWPTRDEIYLIEQRSGLIRRRIPLFELYGEYGGNLLAANDCLVIAQPDGIAVFSEHGPPPAPARERPNTVFQMSPAFQPWQRARYELAEKHWQEATEWLARTRELARPEDEWMGYPLGKVAAATEQSELLKLSWMQSAGAGVIARQTLEKAVATAISTSSRPPDPLAQEDPLPPSGTGHWRLEKSNRMPREARDWVQRELPGRIAESSRAPSNGDEVLHVLATLHDANSRTDAWYYVPLQKDIDWHARLSQVELSVGSQNRAEVANVRHLVQQLESPDERARAWTVIARGLEQQQAWESARTAWQQAVKVAPAGFAIEQGTASVSLPDLLQERLQRPEYARQAVMQASSTITGPYTRNWHRPNVQPGTVFYPEGPAPSIELACVLLDQSPLVCLNQQDGAERWQLMLSHPLRWAQYTTEHLLLATIHELRVVSLSTGATVWKRPLTASGTDSLPFQTGFSLQFVNDRQIGSTPLPVTPGTSQLTECTTSEELILIRTDHDQLLALQADNGNPAWSYQARGGLSSGWALSPQLLVIAERSPANIVVLDRRNGEEICRFPCGLGILPSAPVLRDDGSLMLVGASGKVESWAFPGAAWNTDEGPRTWTWSGLSSPGLIPPFVQAHGNLSLLLLDGTTLQAFDSLRGHVVWKSLLGVSPIQTPQTSLATDATHLYVAADGVLRAIDIASGSVAWEHTLGAAPTDWKVMVQGRAVIASPQAITERSSAFVTICDGASGLAWQRIACSGNGPVRLCSTGQGLLIASGSTLSAWRYPDR